MTDTTVRPPGVEVESGTIFVDDGWRPSHSRGRVVSINPATEQPIGSAPDGDVDDVEAAVRSARAALGRVDWTGTTPAERGSFLRSMAAHLEERAGEIGSFLASENGVVVGVATGLNVFGAAEVLRYYADLGDGLETEQVRGSTIVRREPVGVVGMIVPWNAPLLLAIMKIAPAVLAGCTMVLKPAGETPLSSAYIVDAARAAGLPPGVLNVVTGGRDTGRHLVTHPDVDKIAFTGSTAAGRSIAATCGELMRPATLELGGKSAAIILDDADMSVVLQQVPIVSLLGCGQGCLLSTRLLVSRDRYAELTDGLRETVPALPLGDPLDPNTVFGPLAMERQRDRVEGYIRAGVEQGARLLVGGGRPADQPTGFYVEPTVFVDVDNSLRIAQEEIFGPVLTVTPFDTVDEAVAIANDSDYGLGGTVFTADTDRGVGIARRIETGTIGINGYAIDNASPFGGYKGSGLGRELGPEGLDAYLQYKSIYRPGR